MEVSSIDFFGPVDVRVIGFVAGEVIELFSDGFHVCLLILRGAGRHDLFRVAGSVVIGSPAI